MIATRTFTRDLAECREVAEVGGKGASLGRLIRAGFPVPRGFVVNTDAYRLAREEAAAAGKPLQIPSTVADEIRRAYQAAGAGRVAVRSSATAEDLAAASMAGQCETFLDVEGEEALLNAVQSCWASLDAPRIRAYFAEHQIDGGQVAMAVVVQRLVPADVAGVLFTVSPNGGGRSAMLIEASWGLGEMVVGGHVQPDVLHIERSTGRVLSADIADKQVYLAPGTAEAQPVDVALRKKACLEDRHVQRLWELGNRITKHFAAPQDIEWAIHGEDLFLLQSRPITTHRELEATEAILGATRRRLHEAHTIGRGPWVLHNLAETLPHPTPLTWSVIRRFMSGEGGFAEMYRQAGFEPGPVIDREGFLELIAGRVYMDVARAPDLFGENFPFAYDIEQLVSEPEAVQKPPTVPRGTWAGRSKAVARLAKASARLKVLAGTVADEFRAKTAPAIIDYVTQARRVELASLSDGELIALWEKREREVLKEFGAATLMPGLICGMAWSELEHFLNECFWDEDPEALLRTISAGGQPDHTVVSDTELYEVARGDRPLDTWLSEHGHRGPGEFDLASRRWREQPEALRDMAARLAKGDPPMERYRSGCQAAEQEAAKLRARLSAADAAEFDRRLNLLRRYLPFREDGKDLFMLGYDLLRDLALEAGRRLDLGEGVFYLTREELFDALRVGCAPHHLIEERRLAYKAESRLSLPRVIQAKSIDQVGEETEAKTANGSHKALPISAGQASGPALILQSATDAHDAGQGYILVCPSTDPAWTPLFVNAAGLVLERGGVLSHGAVVAREMGLPAVVLPAATKTFKDGEPLMVNGSEGWVLRTAHPATQPPQAGVADPNDTRVPHELIPPPAGRKDRKAAVVRNLAAVCWGLYLLGFFLLPREYVYRPSIALLDTFLWPLARCLGKPAVVAIVAAGVGVFTLVLQRLITDNRRLLEAKRRAALLSRQAKSLPEDSARRRVFLRMIASVNSRLLVAGIVPVALLLGPLVVSFAWLKDRMDPSIPHGLAGTSAQIVAMVDSDCAQPVQIGVLAPLALDETTPASRTLPPIRKTLEHLLTLFQQPRNRSDLPWELQVVPDVGWQQTAADLRRYLDAGIPPRGITWMIRTPAGTIGRFPVKVSVEGYPAVMATLALGDEFPPGNLTFKGKPDSAIRELRVVYPPSGQKPIFWQPLAGLAAHSTITFLCALARLDIGWLWLYILTYLPVLFMTRSLLRVA